jgi:hypothetical protein
MPCWNCLQLINKLLQINFVAPFSFLTASEKNFLTLFCKADSKQSLTIFLQPAKKIS